MCYMKAIPNRRKRDMEHRPWMHVKIGFDDHDSSMANEAMMCGNRYACESCGEMRSASHQHACTLCVTDDVGAVFVGGKYVGCKYAGATVHDWPSVRNNGIVVGYIDRGSRFHPVPDGLGDNYYNDDEPTLEAEAVNPLQNRCDFLEWQARLYWLAEPKIKDFVAKMAEGRGQDEEDRLSGIAWSRDEFGLKAKCYAMAEEAWNNTTG